jgi:Inner membrane component of T3SS, cytoplasmic domain
MVSTADRSKAEAALCPWLSVWRVDAPARVKTVKLPFSGVCLVGAMDACFLKLDDELVSRRHVELELHSGLVHALDLGSTNGTALNQKSCTGAWLRDGDTLRVGDTCLQVHYPPLGRPTPIPSSRREARRSDIKYDSVRAGVVRVYAQLDGELCRFKREELDRMLAVELGIGERQARRLLDDFAKHLRVPSDVQRAARWQRVADICAGPST